MIQKERIKLLNNKQFRNEKYIIYWMQQSQRTDYNHALEYAINLSDKYNKPLIVYFGLTFNFPDANIRHYKFMFEGLENVKKSLDKRNIKFLLIENSPEIGIIEISKNACIIIVDRGYLKIQRSWRKSVAEKIKCPLIQIESDVVVPIQVTSNKEEYSACTIRHKIHDKLKKYLITVKKQKYNQEYIEHEFDSIDIKNIKINNIDSSVNPVKNFLGGTNHALNHLNLFLKEKISEYQEKRNDPNINFVSNMSLYLHFGQIFPLQIALSVLKNKNPGNESYLEELIIRRELSINFIYYNIKYNEFDGLPDWSKKT